MAVNVQIPFSLFRSSVREHPLIFRRSDTMAAEKDTSIEKEGLSTFK